MRNYTEIEKLRLEKVDRIRARGEQPYPHKAERTHTVAEALDTFEAALVKGSNPDASGVVAILCGRLRSIRTMGKLAFAHIEDASGRMQLMLRADEMGRERLQIFETDFDLGDFVQAEGVVVRTRTGEITLNTTRICILAKSISPLPASKDVEQDSTGLNSLHPNIFSKWRRNKLGRLQVRGQGASGFGRPNKGGGGI